MTPVIPFWSTMLYDMLFYLPYIVYVPWLQSNNVHFMMILRYKCLIVAIDQEVMVRMIYSIVYNETSAFPLINFIPILLVKL